MFAGCIQVARFDATRNILDVWVFALRICNQVFGVKPTGGRFEQPTTRTPTLLASKRQETYFVSYCAHAKLHVSQLKTIRVSSCLICITTAVTAVNKGDVCNRTLLNTVSAVNQLECAVWFLFAKSTVPASIASLGDRATFVTSCTTWCS